MARVYDDQDTDRQFNDPEQRDKARMAELENQFANPQTSAKYGKIASDAAALVQAEKAANRLPEKGAAKPASLPAYDNVKQGDWKTDLRKTVGSRKFKIYGPIVGIIVGVISFALGGFQFLNVWQLENLMANLEGKGFGRFQVDTRERSNKWLTAYLVARMAQPVQQTADGRDDVRNANLNDNVLFRANEVQTGHPGRDWVATMMASTFEDDLYRNDGIRITSFAEIRDGVTVFRPAVITVTGEPSLGFNLSDVEREGLRTGNIAVLNQLQGRLSDFINVEIFETDSAARSRISELLRDEYPGKWWHAFKRWFIRKAIQNMTGIRDWRIFENCNVREGEDRCNRDGEGDEQNRRNVDRERRQRLANKLIVRAFPENTRTGRIVQCLFGIISCRGSTDPNDPSTRSSLQAPTAEECDGASAHPACQTNRPDDGLGQNDGTAEREGRAGMEDAANSADDTSSATKKFLGKLLAKANIVVSVVSMLDTLDSVNTAMKSGALVSLVYMARATADIGIFTVMKITTDQMHTADLDATQVNDAMSIMAEGAGNSEVWRDVVEAGDEPVVTAADDTFTPAADKKEYCSAKHQEDILLPQNEQAAKEELAHNCNPIGGPSLAASITDGWNETIGVILTPILAAYNATGLAALAGWVNGAIDAIVQPIVEGVMSALGLKETMDQLTAWLTAKIASFLGGGPRMPELAPPGMWANHGGMGASAAAEFSTRYAGGAATNPTTKKEATQRYYAYQLDEYQGRSLADKYWSLDNYDSLASRSLFTLLDQGPSKTLQRTFASLFNMPSLLLAAAGGTAFAAEPDDPYALASFAGVKTYDMPDECINGNIFKQTPQSATNADELGLIDANELTWELVKNSDSFYQKLYADNPEDSNKIETVYDCAAFDDMVSGSIAALYDEKALSANAYGANQAGGGVVTQGNAAVENHSKEKLRSSSVGINCATGTKQLGVATGYADEKPVQIQLCALEGVPSSSQESTPGNKYYVEGANGLAIVNSVASANWVKLVADAKAAGHEVRATSSFRTMEHQQDLCNANAACRTGNYVAVGKPGRSNHQMGLAIDIQFKTINNSIGNCTTVDGICGAPRDPFWNWLHNGGAGFDKPPYMSQYAAEFWHWEPQGLRN